MYFAWVCGCSIKEQSGAGGKAAFLLYNSRQKFRQSERDTAMPKRGENIYKRKDGRWEGRYIYDRTPEGKALYHSVYGKTYQDVKIKLMAMREETRKRQLRGCTMTVKMLIDCWMNGNSCRIKESSRERYRLLIDKHIVPDLGAIRICDLTAENLSDFIDRKLRHGRLDGNGGLAPKTVNDIYVLLKSAIKLARSKYKYGGSGLDGVKAPAAKGKKIEVFSGSETRTITEAVLARPTITNISYLLCMETGMRLGEVCALKWSDIDFSDGVVCIRRTAIRINYGGYTRLAVQPPKSEASERTIPLTAKLRNLLAQTSADAAKDAYILTGDTIRPMEPRTLQHRFQQFLKAQNIRKRNFHATRHSFATRCAEHGMDAKSLSEVLGHANIKTTLQMYVHPSMKSKRSFMEAASAMAV